MLCFSTDKTTGQSIVKYDVLLTGVIVMALLSMIALLFAFLGTKERVKAEPKHHEKGAAGKALRLIFGNKSMLSISVVVLMESSLRLHSSIATNSRRISLVSVTISTTLRVVHISLVSRQFLQLLSITMPVSLVS